MKYITKFSILLALLFSTSANAQADEQIPNEIIEYWAKYAIPLEEFVELGYGMSEPEDAFSSKWCPQQPATISLLSADHETCERLLIEMRENRRIN